MASTPAASPSRPSTKFTALIMTITTSTVTARENVEEPMVRPNTGSENSTTPFQAMNPAASTWPASLVTQSRSHRSSATPSAVSSAAAPRMPQAWEEWVKTRSR